MKPQKHDLKVIIKNFSGEEREYNFVALTRKDAAEVFHNSLTALISAIAEVKNIEDQTSILKAIKAIDFETFWKLAEKLLRCVLINGVEIKDINQTDYFDDNPEELYIAVYHALSLNYPKVFSKVRGVLSGFTLPDLENPKTEKDGK